MIKGNCEVIFIVGKRGGGKSNLACNMVKRIDCDRILYYDSNNHDYTDGVICEGVETFKSYIRRVIDSAFKIVFRPGPGMARKYFADVCGIALSSGNLTYVADEVDMFFKKGEPSEELSDLIRRGRHEDITFIGITQRPKEMGEIRSMAGKMCIFETHEPSDLSYYKQSFSPVLVDKIKQLKQYEYVEVVLPFDETKLKIKKEVDGETCEITTGAEVDQPTEPGNQVRLQSPDSSEDHSGSDDPGSQG